MHLHLVRWFCHLQPLISDVLCFDLDREPRLLPWTCKIGASRQGQQRIVLHIQSSAAIRSRAAQIQQLICWVNPGACRYEPYHPRLQPS